MRTPTMFCLALLALTPSACSSDDDSAPLFSYDACQTLVVAPAEDTSAEERASIAAALVLWNERGATRFTLEDVPGAPRIAVTFEQAAPIFHGFYDDQTGHVYVNRAVDDPHARTVTIAHELGHAVGLPHVFERVSVMNEANMVVEPTGEDAAAVVERWGCPPPSAALR